MTFSLEGPGGDSGRRIGGLAILMSVPEATVDEEGLIDD